MSSSTGVRKRRTPEDRINEAIDGVGDAYLRKARKYSDKAFSQGGALGTGPIYGSINPGTNSLQTSGGTMIGSIAFNPVSVVVDDGRINIEPDQTEASKASSYLFVTGVGSPDDLRFIDGADKDGQYLILQATETQILVLKAATISSITSISGIGTVTVNTSSAHNLSNGDKVNILGTDNFNINDVEVTVNSTTQFTYSAIGSIFPETAGFAQNGNIVTPDGNDVILNAAISPNGIPVATLIFDPSVEGFGAWRLVSVSVTTGGGGTTFPILYPKQDIAPGGGVTQTIDLSIITGNAKQIQFPADNIGLAIVGDPVDTVAEDVYVMFIQDSVGGRTLSEIDPRIVNRALINGLINPTALAKTLFRFATVDGGATYFAVLVDLVTGGTVVEFPITPPVLVLGVVFTTQNINLVLDKAHSTTLTLGADIDITFSGFPLDEIQIQWEIEITQDGTTPFVITWPVSVVNPPRPAAYATLGSTTVVVFRTNDSGATIRVGNTVTTTVSGGDVSQWANFTAINDIDYGTFDGINIDRLIFSQSAGEILTSDVVGITSDVSGNFLTNAVGEYRWLVDADTKMQLNASQLTMSANIDMSNKSLFDATEIDFDITNLFNPTTLTIIGFDSSSFGLRYNAGDTTTNHQFEIAGEPMVIINRLSANRGSLLTEQLLAEELLDLATFTNSSPNNGNIWLDDATGLFQFRQNDVTIGLESGVSNVISQGDSNVTVTDGGTGFVSINIDGVTNTKFQVQANQITIGDIPVSGLTALSFRDTVDDATATSLTQNQNDFTINFPDKADDFIIKFAAVQGFIVDELLTRVSSTTPDTTGAALSLFRPDSSPQIGDEVGKITFDGRNTKAPQEFITYATWRATSFNVGENTETGIMRLDLIDSGIKVEVLKIEPERTQIKNFTTIGTNFVELALLKENASSSAGDNIAVVRFNVLDDPVETDYASILGKIVNQNDAGSLQFDVRADGVSDVNALTIEGSATISGRTFVTFNPNTRIASDLKFQPITGGTDFKIFPALNQLGIVVQDNNSFTVGNNGTMAVPVQASLTNPTLALLNAAFGTHVGAMGVFNTSSAFVNIAWKSRSDEWVVIAIPSGEGTVQGEHFN